MTFLGLPPPRPPAFLGGRRPPQTPQTRRLRRQWGRAGDGGAEPPQEGRGVWGAGAPQEGQPPKFTYRAVLVSRFYWRTLKYDKKKLKYENDIPGSPRDVGYNMVGVSEAGGHVHVCFARPDRKFQKIKNGSDYNGLGSRQDSGLLGTWGSNPTWSRGRKP